MHAIDSSIQVGHLKQNQTRFSDPTQMKRRYDQLPFVINEKVQDNR
jgi:hypothetical protein